MAARPMVVEADGMYWATMLPPTSLPKERYPVIATRMYIEAAVVFEVTTTAVVFQWELSLISFTMLNIF